MMRTQETTGTMLKADEPVSVNVLTVDGAPETCTFNLRVIQPSLHDRSLLYRIIIAACRLYAWYCNCTKSSYMDHKKPCRDTYMILLAILSQSYEDD